MDVGQLPSLDVWAIEANKMFAAWSVGSYTIYIFLFIGRLSKEDIERMVQEAEKYKSEDDQQREKVTSKNALESYAFNMKATIEDEKLKGKVGDDDKQKILDKCNEVISWLDKNQVKFPAVQAS